MINKRMKCIISMLCMVPFLAIACESEDQRIQQLQNALQTKKTELSNIEGMIASKEEHINAVVNNMRYLFNVSSI